MQINDLEFQLLDAQNTIDKLQEDNKEMNYAKDKTRMLEFKVLEQREEMNAWKKKVTEYHNEQNELFGLIKTYSSKMEEALKIDDHDSLHKLIHDLKHKNKN